MRETEFPTMLDRSLAKEIVSKHFHEQMELLEELANYGARLITRSFSISEKKQTDIVIIAVLFKQFVTMIDAVQILIQEGNGYASNLPLRALFESQLYLHWMLKYETEKRASQYYIWHLRQILRYNNSSIDGTNENTEFKKILFGSPLEKVLEGARPFQKEIIKQSAGINAILKSKEYSAINLEFERLKKNKTYDVAWYRPWGPKSIADIADCIGQKGEYLIYYVYLSNMTHSQSYDHMITYLGNKLILENIRNIENIDTVIKTTSSICYRVYRSILEKYLPLEVESFVRKYFEEWMERSTNIPRVEYKDGGYINF